MTNVHFHSQYTFWFNNTLSNQAIEDEVSRKLTYVAKYPVPVITEKILKAEKQNNT